MTQKQLMPIIVVGIVMTLVGLVAGVYAAKLPQISALTGGSTVAVAPGAASNFARGQRTAGGPSSFGGNSGVGGNRFLGGQNLSGKVTDISDIALTITMADGSSKIVTLSGSTQFETVTNLDKTKLKAGDTVRVMGPTNSDGSVTAQNVMVNPPTPSPAAQPNQTSPSGSATAQ